MPGPGPDRGRDDPKRESTTPYQGVPHPTRRALLDGIAGIGALALSLALVDQLRLGPVSSTAPPSDAWPLARYDAAGTAHNPNATPPTEPEIDWVDDSLAASRTVPVGMVVGPDAVYASAVGTVALERATGTRQWRTDEVGGPLALHDGTLYVDDFGTLRALAADGTERWATDLPADAASLVVADGTVFVGGTDGVYAYATGSGARKWTDGDGWADHVRVAGGRLLASGDSLTRYRRRSVLDVPLGSPPPVDWTSTVVDMDSVAVTDAGPVVAGHGTDREPMLVALDNAGETRWRAVDDAGEFVAASPVAVADSHCVVGIVVGGERSWHAVGSYRLDDGSRRWRRRLDQLVTDVAVVDGAVIVGTEPGDVAPSEASGTVRALDPADGAERWRVPVDPGCRSLAPVDGTVFAVSTDERVLAIR
jgi:outer membrane protein assembly factor BamB